MNYILEDKIPDIENLKINSENIFFLRNNLIYKNGIVFYKCYDGFNEFSVVDNSLYLLSNGETFIISLKNKNEIKKIRSSIIFKSIFSNKAIFTYERNIKKRVFNRAYYEFYSDITRKNELTNFNTLGKSFFSETLFLFNSKNSNILNAFSYKDEKLWELDLRSISYAHNQNVENKIDKIIGIYNKNLLILLNYGRLLSINVDTGKVIKLTDLIEYNQELVLESIHLDYKNGVLKSLAGRYYLEIDLDNFNLEIKKDFGKYQEGNWWISRSKQYDDLLTFVGSKDGETSFANSFGIFDTRKLDVIWHDGITPEKRKTEGFFSNPPLINKSTLAVINSEKKLFIYKRTHFTQK